MTTTSIGVQELRTRIGAKAKAEPQHRFWGLYTHVWKLDVLREAYRLAKENDGAPGVDGVTFAQVEAEGAEKLVEALSQELREKVYRPLPSRHVNIPKPGGKVRGLKIPAIRDRVVEGAVRLILEPIFEEDFQAGSFGYRPGRSAHQALERVEAGLRKKLHQVIDLDLRSFFDTVRHDLLLAKIARRVRDDDLLWLCKRILKASGKRGIPQGSVIGPLWANVFLDDVDRMLEQIQVEAKQGVYEVVRYTRYADDLAVLVSSHPKARHWRARVEQRLREELSALDLTVNEDKSRTVEFGTGEPFDFLGYTFRWVNQRKDPSKKMVLSRPQKKDRNEFLEQLGEAMRRRLYMPVAKVVKQVVNPRVRGWVNYFRWGNSGRDLSYVAWQVDRKVRRFASRQRPKRRGGRSWTTWSTKDIYETWGLFRDYGVAWCSESRGKAT
ncbi:MAG TPA: group II intron reverse transcriptase/maturase [Kofleriaceae bacterium]|jgi:RNA-directed DNA polymerase|nr:group II intron reverse transcriptase/maturase [Kofleriaceae bacterium]